MEVGFCSFSFFTYILPYSLSSECISLNGFEFDDNCRPLKLRGLCNPVGGGVISGNAIGNHDSSKQLKIPATTCPDGEFGLISSNTIASIESNASSDVIPPSIKN